jgi:hypothetical protein
MTDRSARFQHWFQLITNVAILFGLGLVVYELNQSKQLATGQFVIDNVARQASVQLAMMGEDPREALAKAALRPADLNERDVVALDAYYDSIVLGWFSYRVYSQRAGIDAPWQETVAESAGRVFSSEPARRWLRAWAADQDDTFGTMEIVEIAEKAVQDHSGNVYRSRYELLLAND